MNPRRKATLLLTHAAATLFMAGLIWFVQVVHYPLLTLVGREEFAHYATMHSVRTSWVVLPVMLVEMATAIALTHSPPARCSRSLPIAGLILLVVIWTSTLFVQVPRHALLGSGFDAEVIATLVATNWVRTIGWTLRSALVLFVADRALRAPEETAPASFL